MSFVFLLLGGWGVIISVYQLASGIDSYRQNRGLSRWAVISENLFISVQHLSFERGRAAVVLRGADPISRANREFIENRRRQADEALGKCLATLRTIPEARYDLIGGSLEEFRAMRSEVDRNVGMPRPQRDDELSVRWFRTSTRLIESLKYAVDVLIGNFIPGDARRLATFASSVLELRIVAGTEATLIAQAASVGRKMSAETLGRIHRLRGIEDRLWYEIILTAGYLKIDSLKKEAVEIRNMHMTALRAKQDIVFADLNAGRPLSITVDELIAQSPPTLDGISNVALKAAHEVSSAAERGKRDALLTLAGNTAWLMVLICIMGYSVRYVGRHIVRPLEHIDSKLHRIGAFTSKNSQGNEIDRVRESTNALEKTLEARAAAEADREKTIQELRYAMEQVRTLSGFLPICASCKKIRDDQGYWGQVEEYISKHSDVQFSHGICPDCAKKLYGDLKLKKS